LDVTELGGITNDGQSDGLDTGGNISVQAAAAADTGWLADRQQLLGSWQSTKMGSTPMNSSRQHSVLSALFNSMHHASTGKSNKISSTCSKYVQLEMSDRVRSVGNEKGPAEYGRGGPGSRGGQAWDCRVQKSTTYSSAPIKVPSEARVTFCISDAESTGSSIGSSDLRTGPPPNCRAFPLQQQQYTLAHSSGHQSGRAARPSAGIVSSMTDSRNIGGPARKLDGNGNVVGGSMPNHPRTAIEHETGQVAKFKGEIGIVGCKNSGSDYVKPKNSVDVHSVISRLLEASDSIQTASSLTSSQNQQNQRTSPHRRSSANQPSCVVEQNNVVEVHRPLSSEGTNRSLNDDNYQTSIRDGLHVDHHLEVSPAFLSDSYRGGSQECLHHYGSSQQLASRVMMSASPYQLCSALSTRVILDHVNAISQILRSDVSHSRLEGLETEQGAERMTLIAEEDLIGCCDDVFDDVDDLDAIRDSIPSYPHATICANHLFDEFI